MTFNKAADKRRRQDAARALVAELMEGMECSECGNRNGLRLKHPKDDRSIGGVIRDMVKSGYALDTVRQAVSDSLPYCLGCIEALKKGKVEAPCCPTCNRPMPGFEVAIPETTKVEQVVAELRAVVEAKKAEKEEDEEEEAPKSLLSTVHERRAREEAMPYEDRVAMYEKVMNEKYGQGFKDSDFEFYENMSQNDFNKHLDHMKFNMDFPHTKLGLAIYKKRFGVSWKPTMTFRM